MTDTAFETKVAAIFARVEPRLASRLAAEKAKSENLQSQDTRRVAFTLTEAIEAALHPAVNEALASYDEAINRPMLPNERWEHQLVQEIGQAVESAIQLALGIDREDHPWKPLLAAEGPKIQARLTKAAEQHFAALGKVRKRRRAGASGIPDWVVWVALFCGGVGAGLLLARLLQG